MWWSARARNSSFVSPRTASTAATQSSCALEAAAASAELARFSLAEQRACRRTQPWRALPNASTIEFQFAEFVNLCNAIARSHTHTYTTLKLRKFPCKTSRRVCNERGHKCTSDSRGELTEDARHVEKLELRVRRRGAQELDELQSERRPRRSVPEERFAGREQSVKTLCSVFVQVLQCISFICTRWDTVLVYYTRVLCTVYLYVET